LSGVAWLYDVLRPHVQEVVVCNPRRNALLKEGSKSDKIDARKLAELLRSGMLRAVYHGELGLRMLRELTRSYQVVSKDLKRVMNRVKALYRGWGVPCTGTQVYSLRPSRTVAEEARGSRRTSPRRAVLSRAGRIAAVTS
jgi:transposase